MSPRQTRPWIRQLIEKRLQEYALDYAIVDICQDISGYCGKDKAISIDGQNPCVCSSTTKTRTGGQTDSFPFAYFSRIITCHALLLATILPLKLKSKRWAGLMNN
jgi:hypothetical protein